MNVFYARVFASGFLFLSFVTPRISRAQTPATASKKTAPVTGAKPTFKIDSLPIAALPEVPIEFEFAGTQKDLLGIVQQVARGVTMETSKPVAAGMSKKVQIFSDAELLDMVRDIQFLRAQSFNFLKMEEKQNAARAKAPTTAPTGGSMTTSPEEFLNSMNPKRPKRVDVQEFYGKAFRAQKGNRQLFANSDETTIAVWVFDAPRSWALVTQGPSRAIVVRADGFPRLEAIGRLFKMAVSQN